MEYNVYWWLKNSCFEFFGDEKYNIFEPKSWWKYNIYWSLKSSCFDYFGNGKYGLFLCQKVDGKMVFTDYWKGLVLNFSMMENTVFFESKSWYKDDIYWLLRSPCFELFGDGKWYLLGLFELSMIFQDLGNMVFCTVPDNERWKILLIVVCHMI